MRGNRKKGTKPEVLLRRALRRRGLRYRLHAGDLPGSPDLVFRSAKVAVFCDGDFWHGRGWRALKAKLERRANAGYWVAKIAANRARDAKTQRALTAAGWTVMRFWEADICADADAAAAAVWGVVMDRLGEG